MDWRGRRRSANVEDRRGLGGHKGLVGGGLGTIVLVVLFMVMGGDPQVLLNMFDSGSMVSQGPSQPVNQENDELAEFVSVVLAETEAVWHQLFLDQGLQYRDPKLVLFTGQVNSACGFASAAVGPFYCPGDEKVYIDLAFFQELEQKFKAPGDFAQAYVIAHEIGHHVQNLLGITQEVQAKRQRLSESDNNKLSVMLELQADYLAGVWAHHAHRTQNILEKGDLEEGMRAASSVGDDRLQHQNQGYVVPDSFTHGTSEQRMRWFLKGFKSGDMNSGDTFTAKEL